MKHKTLYLVLALAVGVLLYYSSGPEPNYCSKSFEQRGSTVVMFSTRWCPYCKKARRLFVKNQVTYCEYDVNASTEIQSLFTELGGSGVPLIIIGDETFYGFNELGITNSLIRNGLLKTKRPS